MSTAKVRITVLKEFAGRRFQEDSALRKILVLEKDELEPPEFLYKLQIWIRLLEIESR